jgi:cysteine desulfurase
VCKALQKEGFQVTFLPVNHQGVVDPEDVRKAINKDTTLISIMHVNNETGAIQPIKEIAKISKEYEIPFHADCVQSIGKIPVDLKKIGVNLASASAHKFYGPKGVGFLYIERGIKLAPQIIGGHQERGLRGGTENVPGIVGLGEAAAIARKEMQEEISKIEALRNTLEKGIKERIPEIKIVSENAARIHNTSLVLVKYVEGESMLLSLDLEGICASSGSACTSGSLEPSHVLLACGIPPEEAHGSLRFSLGKYTTKEEIKTVLEVFPKIVERLRSFSPFKI